MSDEFSIDIVSGIDRADLMNAVDYVKKDLLSTYKLGLGRVLLWTLTIRK